MKINGTGSTERLKHLVDSLAQSERKQAGSANASSQAARAAGGDRLDISSIAREFISLRKAIDEAPEIRQQLVDALRDSLQSGHYRIDDVGLAELLTGEFLGGE